jgi:DNA-binding MarR family transcriptional regulator
MYNAEAARFGITTAIGFVLLNIDERLGTPATKLPSLMGLEPNSLSRLLKSMEEKGLISRAPDQNDKRMVRVHLTVLGKQKREVSRRTVLDFNNWIHANIPEAELSVFFQVIRTINTLLESNKTVETVDLTT